MLDMRRSTQFKKDLKKVIKQGRNLKLLEEVIGKLQASEPLPSKNRDHSLIGDWDTYIATYFSGIGFGLESNGYLSHMKLKIRSTGMLLRSG